MSKIISRKELADLCGMRQQALGSYIKRGQLVLTPAGKVNLRNHINAFFFEKHSKEPKQTSKKGGTDKDEKTIQALEKEKKALDIQKISEEIEILKIKKEKASGLVIPTEMVKDLFARHNKSIITEFENTADKILTMISAKSGLGNKEIALYRKMFKDEINASLKEANEATKNGIGEIINQFSEKRLPGERM